MSYNAGSIDSRLTLDRTPFSNDLRAAKAEAREFVRNPIKARLELDRTKADAELRAFEARMAIATRTRTTEIRVDTRTSLQQLQDLQNRINGVPAASRRAREQSQRDFNLIRAAIETLIGPVTVLAGGVGAVAAGLVLMGATGAVAVKALNTEYKTTSRTSQTLHGDVVTLKGDWASLQTTVARGVTPALDRATQQLHAAAPALQSLLGATTGPLGGTVEHLIGGLIGGLQTFRPLLLEVATGVDHAAAGFERWATGAGGERFMHTLQEDLHATVAFLQQAGPAIAHLLSGINTFGLTGLGLLTNLLGIVNKLAGSQGLQTLAIGYLAFRTAVAVTAPLEAATLALQRFAVAEAEAATAGGARAGFGARLAGSGAGVLGALKPILTTVGATVLALNAAANATSGWASSTNKLKYEIHSALVPFNTAPQNVLGVLQRNARNQASLTQLQDTFSTSAFLPGSIGPNAQLNDLSGNQTVETARKVRVALQGQLTQTNAAIAQATARKDALWKQYLAAPKGAAVTDASGTVIANRDSAAQKDLFEQYRRQLSVLDDLNQKRGVELRGVGESSKAIREYKQTYDQYLSSVDRANQRGLNTAFRESRTSGLSGTAQALGTYTQQLQKNIEAEQKWSDVGKGNTVELGKLTVSADAATRALAATGGNVPRAEALLRAHAAALGRDRTALAEAQAEQQRINVAVGDAAAKYSLTTSQVDLYAAAAGISAEAVARGQTSQEAFNRAIGDTARAVESGNVTLNNWVAAVAQFSQGADTAASRASLIGSALISLNGDALQYANQMVNAATANQKLVDDFGKLDKGSINLKKGFLDYHNAGAAPVLQDLAALQQQASAAAAATYQHEVATLGRTKAAKDASDVFRNDTRGALIAEADQLGLTRDQAEKLADRYFKWPKDAKTQIEALGGKDTNSLLDALGQQLAYLTGHPWVFSVDAKLSPNAQRVISGPKGLSFSVARGGIFEAFAAGGEHHVPQIARPGANAVRVWAEPETRGEAYIPLANDWRRPRAKAILSETAARLGGVAFFAGGGETGGFTGVTPPPPPSTGSGSGSGSSATSNPKWYFFDGRWYLGVEALREAQAAKKATGFDITRAGAGKNAGFGFAGQGFATRQEAANARLDALQGLPSAARGELGRFDTKKELTTLAGRSADAIQAAVKRISDTLDAARKARAVPASLVTQFKKDNAELNKALADRDRFTQKVKDDKARLASDRESLKQYGQQVTQSLLGGFDIGTSGNGYAFGIKATVENQIANIEKMNQLVARAKKLGLDPRLIAQLEAEGTQGAANLEAIVKSGQSYVDSLNKDYAKLSQLSTSAGTQAEKDNIEINKQIAADNAAIKADTAKQVAAQREVNRHLAQIREDTRKMQRDLADALIAARKRK